MEGMKMTIFGILSVAINVYTLLCIVRIMISWFQGMAVGAPLEILKSITDPWLNAFRRFRFLAAGGFDFSPIAALTVLSVFSTILSVLATYGTITVGIILAVLFQAIWSVFAFLLLFFAVISGIRLVTFLLKKNSFHPVWRAIDALLNPVLFKTNRIIFRNRIIRYRTSLISGVIVFTGLRVGLGMLADMVTSMLSTLPF